MKVICVDDNITEADATDYPKITRGKLYNVIEEREGSNGIWYYMLLECGNNFGYHPSLFLPIPDDEIDEVELQKEREQLTCNQ